ncbi:MAG TPA: hypothetical protein VH589_09070 [Trebonia sp.]|jgi:hypothetical protein
MTGPGRRAGWTAARVISAVSGVLLTLCSLALLGAGGVAVWATATQRHGGAIDLGTWSYRSPGYAVVSSTADLYGATGGLPAPRSLLGTIRISVTPAQGAGPVFAGIAPVGVASHYLAGVGYDTVRGITHYQPVYTAHRGGAPATAPARAGIWAARAAGPGTQTLTWPDRGGSWTVAAMNADGSRPVTVRISVAASLPSLNWIAAGLLAGGIGVLAGGVALTVVPARRAAHRRTS